METILTLEDNAAARHAISPYLYYSKTQLQLRNRNKEIFKAKRFAMFPLY